MKVLVLGAGGRTGRAVVQRATAAGHEVTAFVHRAGDRLAAARVRVEEGDATDLDTVTAAVAGHDAVIDTIGSPTPDTLGLTLECDLAKVVVTAMQRHGVRRLIVTSSLGVGDSVANAPAALQDLLTTYLRGSTADKAAMEQVVEASGLDWTIARPAVLNDEPATGGVRIFDPATGEQAHEIPRADLAAWLVAQLGSSEHLHRTVTLASS